MAKHYPKLSKILRKFLFERDMKPADLAREVNLPQPTIHRLVTGQSTRPYKSSLEPLAQFFAVSVEQLLGEEPLLDEVWGNDGAISNTASPIIKNIPIVCWNQIVQLEVARSTSQKNVVALGNFSEESFAVVMPDSSMEPFFARGTLLILDPKQLTKDRSYALVHLHENQCVIFRQLLIDGEDRYLKPLNPDLSLFKMRLLQPNDKIVGCLIESRNQYQPDDQWKLLEDSD